MEPRVEGLKDFTDKLRTLVPKIRKRTLGNALRAGARKVLKVAKQTAPVLDAAATSTRRKPGTVRDAIKIRTSSRDRRTGDIGVFINVQPAKGAKYITVRRSFLNVKFKTKVLKRASQRSASSPTDPYYWRFLEFGTKFMGKRAFLIPAIRMFPEAKKTFEKYMTDYFRKIDENGRVIE